ncbi:MAG TPA: SIR2 family protein [Burkholderiales bacterium]|nr:SIR2 family protein [Burkholderiales bacterium]
MPLLQARHGQSLEQKLQEIAAEAPEYPIRFQQLMVVRYYIQYILWQSENHWIHEVAGHVTNHRSLLDQIDRWRQPGDPVCIVTFNYDRIIEDALRSAGVPIAKLSDYTSSERFKLFKVHGSINWVRRVGIFARDVAEGMNQWGAVEAVTERASGLKFHDFEIVSEYPSGMLNGELVVPAIAIPLMDKSDFECPTDHLDLLTSLLPLTSRLLVIGWRATEQKFLNLLSSALRSPVRGYIVAGSGNAAKDIAERLVAAGVLSEYGVSDGGFTEMITRRELDTFLGR